MVDVMVRDSRTGYRLARTTSQLEAIQDSVWRIPFEGLFASLYKYYILNYSSI